MLVNSSSRLQSQTSRPGYGGPPPGQYRLSREHRSAPVLVMQATTWASACQATLKAHTEHETLPVLRCAGDHFGIGVSGYPRSAPGYQTLPALRCAGDHFGIGVSGYPEAHPDVIVEDKAQMEKNYWADIHYLKEKIDAGADFVITQLFYDTPTFIRWVKDCRSVGITAPIIPGIMPIMAYGGFNRMTAFCKTFVPQAIKDKVESLKDDEAGLKEYGIQLGVQMCKQILDAGVSPGALLLQRRDMITRHQFARHVIRDPTVIPRSSTPACLPVRLLNRCCCARSRACRCANRSSTPACPPVRLLSSRLLACALSRRRYSCACSRACSVAAVVRCSRAGAALALGLAPSLLL